MVGWNAALAREARSAERIGEAWVRAGILVVVDRRGKGLVLMEYWGCRRMEMRGEQVRLRGGAEKRGGWGSWDVRAEVLMWMNILPRRARVLRERCRYQIRIYPLVNKRIQQSLYKNQSRRKKERTPSSR